MINTVDNYFSELGSTGRYNIEYGKEDLKRLGKGVEINIHDYLKYKNNQVLSFLNPGGKSEKLSDSDTIISIKTSQEANTNPIVQTGNFVGRFFWDGLEFNIRSRFPDVFLKRMLNFANDVYLDDVDISGKMSDKNDFDVSKFILFYLFVQSLDKAYLLGLPKHYVNVSHHDLTLKGKIDLNRYINKDIPFLGRISTTSREQQEEQAIIDVLYASISIIESCNILNTDHIAHVKRQLRENRTKMPVSKVTVDKALSSKSLNNPIFSEYRKVLEYAKIILQNDQLEESKTNDKKYYGFVIDVAELFEIYISKLLKKEFKDWMIDSPVITTYQDQFFKRRIIPDIVMKRGKDVIVFDTKYKRMRMIGSEYSTSMGDVDRSDFFQINTYMSYFSNQGLNVILGGLLYPMEEFNQTRCHADGWFGNTNTKFIVDGVEVSLDGIDDFYSIETNFVNRVSQLLS